MSHRSREIVRINLPSSVGVGSIRSSFDLRDGVAEWITPTPRVARGDPQSPVVRVAGLALLNRLTHSADDRVQHFGVLVEVVVA
jgi:hypothetical protein